MCISEFETRFFVNIHIFRHGCWSRVYLEPQSRWEWWCGESEWPIPQQPWLFWWRHGWGIGASAARENSFARWKVDLAVSGPFYPWPLFLPPCTVARRVHFWWAFHVLANAVMQITVSHGTCRSLVFSKSLLVLVSSLHLCQRDKKCSTGDNWTRHRSNRLLDYACTHVLSWASVVRT